MAGISTGVFKKLFIKRQTGLGVIAPPGPAQSARSMRRVTSTLDLAKASYQSAEVLESQQVRDSRHGVRSVAGTLTGELSVGGYQQPMESVLRQPAQQGGAFGLTEGFVCEMLEDWSFRITALNAIPEFTFLGAGFKVGDICNAVSNDDDASKNNNHYFMIVDLKDRELVGVTLDKKPVFTFANADLQMSAIGKKIYIPETGQTRDYYTVEHWFGDIGESEVFKDTVFGGMNIGLPPTGMATIEFPMMGLNMITGKQQYFTAPAGAARGAILAAANGILVIKGAVAGLVTGLTIAVSGAYAFPTGDGLVGSNERPDVLPGVLTVTGQMTVLFSSGYYRDLFLNEEEASIASIFTADNSAAPQFTAFVMSRVKYSGATKDDTNTGITLTMPYQALENINADAGPGKPNLQTTISIQDSAFI